MKKTLIFSALVASPLLLSVSSNAALVAAFANGTDIDAAALLNDDPNVVTLTGLTVSNLSIIGLDPNFGGTGATITRNSFGPATVPGVSSLPGGGTTSASSEWLFGRTGGTNDPANTATDYVQFTLTASAGNLVSLNTLSFDYFAVVAAANLIHTGDAIAFVSTDGGTNFTQLTGAGATADSTGLTGGIASAAVAANVNLGGIADSPEAIIRIGFGRSAGNAGFSGTGFIQNLQLDADVVAVPEPSSTLLSIVALGALGLRRRR